MSEDKKNKEAIRKRKKEYSRWRTISCEEQNANTNYLTKQSLQWLSFSIFDVKGLKLPL